MEKLTTKKGLYELLENGYGMKLTEHTFEKAKNFIENIKNDEAYQFKKHREKYIKLIKDLNVKNDLDYINENNWSDDTIKQLLFRYHNIINNILNNVEKFNKLEKIQVKSSELYIINRKSYIQKKNIFIDKKDNLIKSKYSFFEYEILKLNN